MEIKHSKDDVKGRFDVVDGADHLAEMTYVVDNDGDLIVNHTYVRHKYRDQGIAQQLLDHVVDYARTNNLKIDPTCPYVKSVFEESDAYDDIWKK